MAYRVAESANDRIEAWCMNMCNASEASYRRSFWSRKQPENVYSHLRVQLEQAPQKLNADEESVTGSVPSSLHTAIASEMLDHCAAPQETAGTVLSFCMHQLSLEPSIQESLRKELCSALPELNTYSLGPRDLETLDYLHAVILETLRLHNHTPGPPRIAPDSGCTLAGFSSPSGTRVSALAYVLHRNETVFAEAELFRPERWTDVSESEKVRMRQHIWAFGSGDRQCIALHFATIGMPSFWWFTVERVKADTLQNVVMKMLVATIYFNFRTTLAYNIDRVQTTKRYLPGSKGTPLLLYFEKAEQHDDLP